MTKEGCPTKLVLQRAKKWHNNTNNKQQQQQQQQEQEQEQQQQQQQQEQEQQQQEQQQEQQTNKQTNWKDLGSFSSTTNSEQFKSNQCRLSQPFCQWLEPGYLSPAWALSQAVSMLDSVIGVRSGVGTVHVS